MAKKKITKHPYPKNSKKLLHNKLYKILKSSFPTILLISFLFICANLAIINSKISTLHIKSYGNYLPYDNGVQYVSLLIEHDKSQLKYISILVLNLDNTINILNIPLDYLYLNDNNQYINLKDIYGLNYLLEDESKSFSKLQHSISHILNIDFSNYFVITTQNKEKLSKVFDMKEDVNLDIWITQVAKKINEFKLITRIDEIKSDVNDEIYSSLDHNNLVKILSAIKNTNLIKNIEVSSIFLNELNVGGNLTKVVDNDRLKNLLIKLLQQQAIIDEQTKIELFNATPVLGLGKTIASRLLNYGLNIARVNYISDIQSKSTIYVQSNKPFSTHELSQVLNGVNIVYGKSPYTSVSDIVIVIGNDLATL